MTRFFAPAKVNLTLHVTGKRADGFHLLESLVVFTQFGDWLSVEPADTFSLSITGPYAASLDAQPNLVLKAAQKLQQLTGMKTAAGFTLEKHIPVGAGLGGGSADAAAALRLLARLWKLPANDELLYEAARSVGSDVSACLLGKSAQMSGVGEKLAPVKFGMNAWLLLANPDVELLTSDVFSRYAPPFSPAQPLPAFDSFDTLVNVLADCRNDLEAPAITLRPVIAKLLEALRALPHCALARMSGSGATCFALFANEQQARAAQQQLHAQHKQWWSVITAIRKEPEHET